MVEAGAEQAATGQVGTAMQVAQAMGLAAQEMKKQIRELFSTEGRPGLEGGVNKDNIVISRVKLLQGLSEEVKQDAKTFQAGLIIDSVTKEVLPKSFIVLAQMPSSWIYFNPRDKKHKHFIPEFGQAMLYGSPTIRRTRESRPMEHGKTTSRRPRRSTSTS